MTSWQKPADLSDYMVRDHLHLCKQFKQLQSMADTPVSDEEFLVHKSAVSAKLETLAADLQHHFRQEESGGYLEEATIREPKLGCEMDRLIAEHPILLKQLAELRKQLANHCSQATDWPAVQSQLQCFLQALNRHEQCELVVMQSGLNEDLTPLLDRP